MNRVKLPVAVHIFLLRSGSVLLLRRFNTGFEDGNYSLVGGHLEGGESVPQAAIRECREDVGVEIDRADLEGRGGHSLQLSDGRRHRLLSECDPVDGRAVQPRTTLLG